MPACGPKSPPMHQVSAEQSRLLLLAGQGLSGGRRSLEEMLEQLGFVQLDSINTVARAHELTLHARLPDYRHESLFELLPSRRAFEHWTHDASLLPASAWRYWGARCQVQSERVLKSAWWRERMGDNASAMNELVRRRLKEQGPCQSRDFESARREPGGWWNWKPEKAALEFLWMSGEVTVVNRRNFHKVYDFSANHLGPPPPPPADLVDWACRRALERLGVATPGELAAYWKLVSPEQARQWCRESGLPAVKDSQGRAAVALPDWADRAAAVRLPRGIRLLSPFDPILRDRARALRLFGFDFRFEAFVPAAQRKHGYYSLPILEGQRLIGRLTPKLERKHRRLLVQALHWEPGIKPGPARLRELQRAIGRLAAFLGAEAPPQREICPGQEAAFCE